MKILFLDQSGKSGGAELCLLDTAKPYQAGSLIGLFEDGPFRSLLEEHQIPVQVLSQTTIRVRKESSWLTGLSSLSQLLPLVARVVQLSRQYDLIFVNTPKALVVGAVASFLTDRPLVYHLHDILSREHFSASNRRLLVTLANRAAWVIANSQATRSTFIAAGGRSEISSVVYNGFQPEKYTQKSVSASFQTGISKFTIGHFSRLSPWKGQHILIEALTHCPEDVTSVFVGDALFGEQKYVQQLHQQIEQLGLRDRVQFLGFRADVISLMGACDLIAHTSTAAEPFGRVIVEAMLCGKPVIAAKAGGAAELIDHGVNGWLVAPGEPKQLAEMIQALRSDWQTTIAVAQSAQRQASDRFHLEKVNQQIHQRLTQVLDDREYAP
ncbi:MAG: glycosyltransferase [Leptolyngbyaceae cyanobacterium CSU_1_3]|nr:glycosyltransferase [Leptolyngbyaceae cyanobacterium CSU_1_3]